MVARGIRQVLPRSQVALRRDNARVAQAQLDLLQRRAALACQFGEGAPEVVRREAGRADDAAILLHHLNTACGVMFSPVIYPALMLALNAGIRDAEIRGLQWGRVDLSKKFLVVGESKTAAGEGRTIPLNSDLHTALIEYTKWYTKKFGMMHPDWFVFPWGKPRPSDPTRPMVTLKTSWKNVKKKAGVQGRWHDNRHTFITGLAESGEAGDETIRDIAGHVSKQMLRHYSHIGMESKRRAVEALVAKEPNTEESAESLTPKRQATNDTAKVFTKVEAERLNLDEGDELQVLEKFGSSGRIRTYNPSVNSRMLYR